MPDLKYFQLLLHIHEGCATQLDVQPFSSSPLLQPLSPVSFGLWWPVVLFGIPIAFSGNVRTMQICHIGNHITPAKGIGGVAKLDSCWI